MVRFLGDDFDFRIVTRDRDLGDVKPYPKIRANEWQAIDGAKVFYMSPQRMRIKDFFNIFKSVDHDLVYFNSFFDPVFTIIPLFVRRYLGATNKQVILAPRGELSAGALMFKATKKLTFIKLSTFLGLYQNVFFHASSDLEANEIANTLKLEGDRIRVALNLPQPIIKEDERHSTTIDHSEHLKIVFLSRISPKKNLDYALRLLCQVEIPLEFNIYGTREDPIYWEECRRLIDTLPSNISARYCGSLNPADVGKVFSEHDLFLFPTKGENYGHVIAESLSAGTPVLISDLTPWNFVETDGVGWTVPLSMPERYVQTIATYARRSISERIEMRSRVKEKAIEYLSDAKVLEKNYKLFADFL